MNLVSRKMVIKELKDRFLVRSKYGSGQFGEAVFAVESGLCGGIMRIFTLAVTLRRSGKTRQRRIRHFFLRQCKKAILTDGLLLNLMPGSSLLSHGETPHYHRRYGVSLLSSAWGQVGPPRYGRQANSVLLTRLSPVNLICYQAYLLMSHPPKHLRRCKVKPHGSLVPVSSTHRCAYTPGLSTSSSSTFLQETLSLRENSSRGKFRA